jgi:two-component system, OmpR family, aerobic respiration control sensor histidine kinase ArcB
MSEYQQGQTEPESARPEELNHTDTRLALLGHDLRAAVSDIIGGLRLIDQRALDKSTQLQLERIRSAGEVLARLLEEGLSAMLGDEEALAVHPVNIQMSRFLYDLEMRWSGRARERGLPLILTVAPGLPPVIATDRSALERILSNILSNAIKYTDEGEVRVTVGLAPDGSLGFRVTDNGPGFSRAALDRLFQYHGRPDDTVKPGQGLGMHISKLLTGRLGGTITVENRMEGGASVSVELPKGAWQPVAPGVSADLPDLSSVKVLLAEDSPTNQLIIGQMLSQMGAAFEVAADGLEALHWLEREDFDIALIDIEMPRLSGIEVIRQLRANDRLHSHMPIVAVTAYVLRANREAIYASGADAILSKPIPSIEALGQAISGALDRRSDNTEPKAVIGEIVPELDRARFDHLMEIAGPGAVRELLDRLGSDLRRAERSLFAGITARDRSVIRAETHVLIALAGAVGADRLMKLAETLNGSAHRRDDPARDALGSDTMAAVDRLINVVATERARLGDGLGDAA